MTDIDRPPYRIPKRILDAAVMDCGGPEVAGWVDHHGVIHVSTMDVTGAMTFTASLAGRLVAAAAARGAGDAEIARAGTVALVKSSFNALDASVRDKGGTESSVVVMSMRNCVPVDEPAVAETPAQADAEVKSALDLLGITHLAEQWSSRPASDVMGVATLIKVADHLPDGMTTSEAANQISAAVFTLPGVVRIGPFTNRGVQLVRAQPK